MRAPPALHLPPNVGRLDRGLRIVLGLAVLALGMGVGSWWGALGLGLVGTGLVGFSPLYRLVGVRTRAR